ncbi:hypothetical protein BDZ94DRAFT_1257915 [Collybia nuda]|uniref:Uncharacterized protein n=1 Tax=Collybia nuda TaxID=64659 RepID=A0A9P5Y8Z7_9AGAR|nr:hypothetical protein BDZ94DRAFT_1257915 [Collybia nuda]
MTPGFPFNFALFDCIMYFLLYLAEVFLNSSPPQWQASLTDSLMLPRASLFV